MKRKLVWAEQAFGLIPVPEEIDEFYATADLDRMDDELAECAYREQEEQ